MVFQISQQKKEKIIKKEVFKELVIPKTFGAEISLIIGKRGYGKSYCGGVIAEELHKQEVPFIFFDPQQANVGLSELKGVKLYRISDPQLNAEKLAVYLKETNESCVVALNSVLEDNRIFLQKFLDEYMTNPEKGIRIIILDETHLFAPNKERVESSESIVRLVTTMRGYGIGFIMMAQRVSTLDTTIVNQADNYFIFRISGLRDLKIADELIGFEIETKEEIKKRLVELRNFKAGECLVISASVK